MTFVGPSEVCGLNLGIQAEWSGPDIFSSYFSLRRYCPRVLKKAMMKVDLVDITWGRERGGDDFERFVWKKYCIRTFLKWGFRGMGWLCRYAHQQFPHILIGDWSSMGRHSEQGPPSDFKLYFIEIKMNKLGWAEQHSRFPLQFSMNFPRNHEIAALQNQTSGSYRYFWGWPGWPVMIVISLKDFVPAQLR